MKNGRCRRHGGKTPPTPTGLANPNAKMGIYSRFLSESDQALYHETEIGKVDDELRLMRVRLARTVKARADWEAQVAAGQIDAGTVMVERVNDESVTKDGVVVPTTKRTFRLPDFDKIEQACLARIESLEKTRKELIGEGAADSAIEIEGGLPPPDLEPDEPA